MRFVLITPVYPSATDRLVTTIRNKVGLPFMLLSVVVVVAVVVVVVVVEILLG